MRIEFTGRKTEVAEALRRLGERRLSRLARLLPGITRAHVVLSADRHRQVAEVSIRSPHLDLLAREAGVDFGASLAAAFEKLERQAHHHVGKRIDRRRRAAPTKQLTPSASRAASATPREAPSRPRDSMGPRFRRVVPRHQAPEQALLELKARPEGFLLFKDSASGRLRLLVRGSDGRPSLLEPEA